MLVSCNVYGVPERCVPYTRDFIRAANVYWDLGAPIPIVAAQMYQESKCNPNARSPTGAIGLAQFLRSTANWMHNIAPELGIANPANPKWAIQAMWVYNRYHYKKVGGSDECNKVASMLAAYNGGLGSLYKANKHCGTRNWWSASDRCAISSEMRNYPKIIIYSYQELFTDWSQQSPLVCIK